MFKSPTQISQISFQHVFPFICVLVMHACLNGCSSVPGLPGAGDDETAEEARTAKPPIFVDFESLSFGIGGFPIADYRPGQTITPHIEAYLAMLDIQNLLESRLGVSVEALKAALAATATQSENTPNSWIWSHSFNFDGADFAGSVVSVSEGGVDQWSLTLTRSPLDEYGCCEDFLWMSGTRESLGEGEWTIRNFRSPSKNEDMAYVKWKLTDLSHKQLEFFVKTQDPEFSEWVEEGSVIFSVDDKILTIVAVKDPLAEQSSTIIWNDETGAGSIAGQDGVRNCWDANQATIACE